MSIILIDLFNKVNVKLQWFECFFRCNLHNLRLSLSTNSESSLSFSSSVHRSVCRRRRAATAEPATTTVEKLKPCVVRPGKFVFLIGESVSLRSTNNVEFITESGGGWVYHLFVYICWSYRMVVILCYNSMAPSTCKDNINASAIYYL